MKFRCNQSGNVFEFFTEHDIKTMRAHSEYTELVQASVELVEPPEEKETVVVNKQPPQKRSYNKANKEE
jgi:hypothetical protein